MDIREDKKGLNFAVIVQPRASKNEIAGIHGQALKIRLTAPPVDGGANAACIAFLSKTLRIPQKNIKIIRGTSSRNKLIRVIGIDSKNVLSRLGF